MSFDVKMATSLVNIYDGRPEGLDAFLGAVDLLKTLSDAGATTLTILNKFVKTRLIGKARDSIENENIELSKLLEHLRRNCGYQESSESVGARLRSIKQGSSNVVDYSERISELNRKLVLSFKAEGLGDSARKMAEKLSLEALIGGLANAETSIILKAGNFKTFLEAANKAISVDRSITKSIYAIAGQQNYRLDAEDDKTNGARCFTCGHRGHTQATCYTKSTNYFCTNCRVYGHHARNCVI